MFKEMWDVFDCYLFLKKAGCTVFCLFDIVTSYTSSDMYMFLFGMCECVDLIWVTAIDTVHAEYYSLLLSMLLSSSLQPSLLTSPS